MIPDVMEPRCLRFRCYEPVIVGGFMVTPCQMLLALCKMLVGLGLPSCVVVGGFRVTTMPDVVGII